MKKHFLLLLFAFTLLAGQAQNPADCTLVINGKEFSPGSKISKADLLKFCPLAIKDGQTGKIITTASVKWMIDHKGHVFKGANPIDCSKLIQAVNEMTSGDVIFIEEMKFKELFPRSCNGQFILRLE